MKLSRSLTCLALFPGTALAHEGLDPASVVHAVMHAGEALGAVAVAVAVFALVLRRKRRSVSRDGE